MHQDTYFPPEYTKGQFHCPHCGVFAKQFWAHIQAQHIWGNSFINKTVLSFDESLDRDWAISKCEHCSEKIVWHEGSVIYPKTLVVKKPNKDLSEEIQADYLEAANVVADSPRSAAAILRLALQKLCKELGEKGKNINEDIAELVKKGLNPVIQKSLDALRITGNNAVHPGELDLTEDSVRVIKLFDLLNFIADKLITEPREVEKFYAELPDGAKQAVEKRDQSPTNS